MRWQRLGLWVLSHDTGPCQPDVVEKESSDGRRKHDVGRNDVVKIKLKPRLAEY